MSAAVTRGYLLDTSVVSAFAPGKPALPAELTDWLRTESEKLFLPCIAIAELEQGIRKLQRSGAVSRAAGLKRWLEDLIRDYSDKILPLDTGASRLAGKLSDAAMAEGRHPGFPDIAIAAIAQQHGLLILTANLRHFSALGARCADPFHSLPK